MFALSYCLLQYGGHLACTLSVVESLFGYLPTLFAHTASLIGMRGKIAYGTLPTLDIAIFYRYATTFAVEVYWYLRVSAAHYWQT